MRKKHSFLVKNQDIKDTKRITFKLDCPIKRTAII